MIKFLRFNTSNGVRLINVDSCDIVNCKSSILINIEPVPYNNAATEINISGTDFDGGLIDNINEAILRAARTSYTDVMIDVVVPSKYTITDILQA